MDIEYKYWQPNSGLEEFQAKIYNENNPDNPNPVTAKDIIQRYENEKIDPKTVRYAFSKGEPLAYIQARDYEEVKETHLGYPWALPGCPEEVQDKLFDEMLVYVKTRDVDFPIRINIAAQQEAQVEFVKKRKDLEVVGKGYRKELDVKMISKLLADEGEFKIRKATIHDVEILVNLIKEDGRYAGQFNTDDEIGQYFSERVLPDDKCYLAFKGDKLVMATAPLITKIPGDTEDRLILRFHSYLPDSEPALKPLLVHIARECVNAEMDSKPLSMYEGTNTHQIIKDTVRDLEPVGSEVQGFVFGLKQ
jgi:hypothetical protein